MESVVDSRSRSLGSRPGCGYSSEIFTYLLPIMPVWHIGQQQNPSNPVYL